MNTKQIRLTTTASTRANTTTTRKKHNIQNTNNKRLKRSGNIYEALED
jgi:hypothetical protein